MVVATCLLVRTAALFFFKPTADGVASHPESARQATQTASLMVSAQDGFAPLFGVAVWLWIVAATMATMVAKVTLFTVLCFSIANNVFAAAMLTF